MLFSEPGSSFASPVGLIAQVSEFYLPMDADPPSKKTKKSRASTEKEKRRSEKRLKKVTSTGSSKSNDPSPPPSPPHEVEDTPTRKKSGGKLKSRESEKKKAPQEEEHIVNNEHVRLIEPNMEGNYLGTPEKHCYEESLPPHDSDDDDDLSWAQYDEQKRRSKTHDDLLSDSENSVFGPTLSNRRNRRSHIKSISSTADLKNEDRRVKINCGGTMFETYLATIRKYPTTMLGVMFDPRNAALLKLVKSSDPTATEDIFLDRNPRVFSIILDFYRTGQITMSPDVSSEMLHEELLYFQIDLPELSANNRRISVELKKLEYSSLIGDASEYRKLTKMTLLREHRESLGRIVEFITQKVERKALSGKTSTTITFSSPLHFTSDTPKEIFKAISTPEIREILVELLETKGFKVKEDAEYSKKKATSIIGLHDQVTFFNDPKFFTFYIKW